MLLLLACAAPVTPTGAILISLGGLRTDRIGAYGSELGLTPNLDKLAAESIIFDQAYAQSNETLGSLRVLLSGQLPGAAGAYVWGSGRVSAAVVADPTIPPEGLLGLSVSTQQSLEGATSLREAGPAALRWLDANPGPSFLFVQTADTEDRYLKPSPFGYAFADPLARTPAAAVARVAGRTSQILDGHWTGRDEIIASFKQARPRFSGGQGIRAFDPDAVPLQAGDLQYLGDVYDGAVAWTDAALGLFLAGLSERGRLDTDVIVVVADHGVALGEGGAFGPGVGVGDAETHVPLIVRLPGGANRGRRLLGLTGLVDVLPTIVDLLGEAPPTGIAGQSLRPAIEGAPWDGREVVYTEGALRSLSVRGPMARLSVEGMALDNPFFGAMITAAPIDGISLTFAGDGAERAELRSALSAYPGLP